MDFRDPSPDSRSASNSSNDNASSPPSTPGESKAPLHLLFLGSSLGNFARREDTTEFLASLPLRPGSGDTLLLGLDHENPPEVIEAAYRDSKGLTREFILNGLKSAGRALGDEKLFDSANWEYVNKYSEKDRCHEAFFKCVKDHKVKVPDDNTVFHFTEDELVKIEQSLKFSEADVNALFTDSGLRPIQRWTDSTNRYSLWLLERPAFFFPRLSAPTTCNSRGLLAQNQRVSKTPFGVPSPQEWENLWTAWSFVTRKMIPQSMLYQKPIDLRHICLFYLGHIPTFLDIHLSRLLNEPHTEPENFKDIFERGIDPNVDDPTQVHSHSEVPTNDDDWPKLASILEFQSKVRERVLKLYADIESGKRPLDRKTGRVLFMTLEHEAMHLETLLYMLLQRAGTGTIPPTGFSPPDWSSLKEYWNGLPGPAEETVVVEPATITIGHDDVEREDANANNAREHEYGWDNESPKREVSVGRFKASWRPITNRQFFDFYTSEKDNGVKLPASWVEDNGEIKVRTFYGPVSIDVAQHWPVMTTYDDLALYAKSKGGRIPSQAELLLFYKKYDCGYDGGANIGFRNWHPIPATTGGVKDGGKGTNGGVLEWTSTVFDSFKGYVASDLYPGYSADFFDGVHNVLVGGSFATIPRLYERGTWVNWYQRNYAYPWVGARVVYDI